MTERGPLSQSLALPEIVTEIWLHPPSFIPFMARPHHRTTHKRRA
jgi:hypothetical protein